MIKRNQFHPLLILIVCCFVNSILARYRPKNHNAAPIDPQMQSCPPVSSSKHQIKDTDQAIEQGDELENTECLRNLPYKPGEGPIPSPEMKLAEQTQTPQAKTLKTSPLLAETESDELIDVNLDKADLLNVLQWIETVFKVTFLSGDAIKPEGPGKVAGNVISFKTNNPLTRKELWNLFLSFLDLMNMALVPMEYTNEYPSGFKVTPSLDANKAPIPSFLGINWELLPENDTKIRYIYFVENTTIETIFNLVNEFKSRNAILQRYDPQKALIITDTAINIRSLLQIIKELDTVTMPEVVSVLKLKHASVIDVKALYDQLIAEEQKTGIESRILGVRKPPTATYFPENTRLVAEPRSNSLIILGTQEGIGRVENFISTYVDTELQIPYSPLYIYELQYANADDMATVLNRVTSFAKDTPEARFGGIRGGDKYLRPMTFVPEKSGNRLLVRAEKEDYIKIAEIVKTLDVKQPQVAVEVLIVNVTGVLRKEFGTQLRNKFPNTLSNNVDFQTSGFPDASQGIVVNETTGSLIGNLVSLAQNQLPGSTIISIGTAITGGVWAIFKMLQTFVHADVVSHPFLITTNNYQASVSIGETRHVVTSEVSSAGAPQKGFQDVDANLVVQITPQINSDGIIALDIYITVDQFTNALDPSSATKDTKTIRTKANIANKEVLALGGLLRQEQDVDESQVPLLGNIPIIGWFFKNKRKTDNKNNLLVFISPQIIEPRLKGGIGQYTVKKSNIARNIMSEIHLPAERRDPIHRWFFNDTHDSNITSLDSFISTKNIESYKDITKSTYYCNRSTPIPTDTAIIPVEEVAQPEQAPEPVLPPPAPTTPIAPVSKRNSISQFVPNDREIMK